jgi:hypothetical protein
MVCSLLLVFTHLRHFVDFDAECPNGVMFEFVAMQPPSSWHRCRGKKPFSLKCHSVAVGFSNSIVVVFFLNFVPRGSLA